MAASAPLSTAGAFRTRGIADQRPMYKDPGGILIPTAADAAGADVLAEGEGFFLLPSAGVTRLTGLDQPG